MYTYSNETSSLSVENARLSDIHAQVEAGRLADQIDMTRVLAAARRLGQLVTLAMGLIRHVPASIARPTTASIDAR